MGVYRSDVVSLVSAEAKPSRSVHRLDEPAGLSLSMFASPQCRFRFARQNRCSAAATSAVNFRMARNPGADAHRSTQRVGGDLVEAGLQRQG
jgi:hypothetical protein